MLDVRPSYNSVPVLLEHVWWLRRNSHIAHAISSASSIAAGVLPPADVLPPDAGVVLLLAAGALVGCVVLVTLLVPFPPPEAIVLFELLELLELLLGGVAVTLLVPFSPPGAIVLFELLELLELSELLELLVPFSPPGALVLLELPELFPDDCT